MDAIFFMTRECNLDCKYCYIDKKPKSYMTEDIAFKGVDTLLKNSKEKAKISFFGGEPLLNFGLIKETVKYAEKKALEKNIKIRFSIATNGTLLTKERIDFLGKHNFTVELSLDGNEKTHNMTRPLTKGGGSYSDVIRHLPYLKKKAAHVVAVGVLAAETAHNASESAIHVIDELGISNFVLAMDYTGKWSENDIEILQSEYEKLSEWYLEKSRKSDDYFYFSLFDAHIAAHVKGGFKPGSFCDVGKKIFAVGEDGRIFPCVRFAGKAEKAENYLMGDVYSGIDLKSCKVIVAENHKPRTDCSGCALDGRCFTYCPCLNWDTTGKFYTIPALLCAHESKIVPVADRLARTLFSEKNRLFMRKHYKLKGKMKHEQD